MGNKIAITQTQTLTTNLDHWTIFAALGRRSGHDVIERRQRDAETKSNYGIERTGLGKRACCVIRSALFHSQALKYNFIWLAVWNIFYFSIYWEKSFQLTLIFFRGVGLPPTSHVCQLHTESFCDFHHYFDPLI